ncbi:hypothetical protein ACP70R_020665 [Stipagrostis hirtigluma subsp. patula]
MGAASPPASPLATVTVAQTLHLSSNAASVVVGLARCADWRFARRRTCGARTATASTRARPSASSKAPSGDFSVLVAANLHSPTYLAGLHSAAGTPYPRQEPSRNVPRSEDTFFTVTGNEPHPSPKYSIVTFNGPIKKHFFDHFHNKPKPPEAKPRPKPKLKLNPKLE